LRVAANTSGRDASAARLPIKIACDVRRVPPSSCRRRFSRRVVPVLVMSAMKSAYPTVGADSSAPSATTTRTFSTPESARKRVTLVSYLVATRSGRSAARRARSLTDCTSSQSSGTASTNAHSP